MRVPDGNAYCRAAEGVLALLGTGLTADIFEWESNRVLRLYREWASPGWIRREMATCLAIHEAGLPSPAVYPAETSDGLVQASGRMGFVLERIQGPTMLEDLSARPWRLKRHARTFSELHRSMHCATATNLPRQKDVFKRLLRRIDGDLKHEVAEQIRSEIDELFPEDRVCHNDFHLQNVVLCGRGPVIIDWGPACSGSPAADIAWTSFLFRYGSSAPSLNTRQRFLSILAWKRFLRTYHHFYRMASDQDWTQVERWCSIIRMLISSEGLSSGEVVLARIIQEQSNVYRSRDILQQLWSGESRLSGTADDHDLTRQAPL